MAALEGEKAAPSDDLGAVLIAWAGGDRRRSDIAEVVVGLASGARNLAAILARGPLAGDLNAATGAHNADGDVQKAIDVVANGIFIAALQHTPAAFLASEESDAPIALRKGGTLAVAIDPLDGSGNVGVNLTVGRDLLDLARCRDGARVVPAPLRGSARGRLFSICKQHAVGADARRWGRSLRA